MVELHPSKHIQTLFELWTRSRTERLQCKSWWIMVNLVNHFIHVHTYTSFKVIPVPVVFPFMVEIFWYFLPWPNWYSIDPPAARIKRPVPGPGHPRAILLLLELCWSKGSHSSCVFLANSIGSTDGFNGNPKETLALTLNHDIKVCFLQVSA